MRRHRAHLRGEVGASCLLDHFEHVVQQLWGEVRRERPEPLGEGAEVPGAGARGLDS